MTTVVLNNKIQVFTCVLLAILFTSCSIQKRRYNSGFHINWYGIYSKPNAKTDVSVNSLKKFDSAVQIVEGPYEIEQLRSVEYINSDFNDGKNIPVFASTISANNLTSSLRSDHSKTPSVNSLFRPQISEKLYTISPNEVLDEKPPEKKFPWLGVLVMWLVFMVILLVFAEVSGFAITAKMLLGITLLALLHGVIEYFFSVTLGDMFGFLADVFFFL